jgi:3-hydroxyisobutyrate dehydrogenase
MVTVAFLGTGLLGSAMVEGMLRRGDSVTVWNRTEAKSRALEAFGAKVAATPGDAVAGAERVHMTLPDDAVVDEMLTDVVPRLRQGALIADHSTTSPRGTSARVTRLRDAGVKFVHAPVFMSPQMATDGVGLMLVSGPRAEFEDVRAELESMTSEVWYLGERPDLAAAYKLFGNCMLFAISGGLADVMAMARANDIDPVDALSVFSKFQAGNIIQARGPRMARGEVTPPSFTVEMARKDVRLMMTAAKQEPLVALPCVAQRVDEVIASGGAEHDLAALGAAPVPRT